MREKIITIIGHGVDPERAECMADEIIELYNELIYDLHHHVEYLQGELVRASDAAYTHERRANEAESEIRQILKHNGL